MKFATIVPLLVAIQEAQSIDTWDGGPTFAISSEKDKKLKLDVTVPNSMYLGIAFGSGMTNTDLV